jgi:hypothetical protein
LQTAPLTDQQRFLLAECFEVYLPLDEAQQRVYDQLSTTEPYNGAKAVNATSFEKGMEKERRDSLRMLLENRFGPMSEAILSRLEQLPFDQLRPLQLAVLKANLLSELGLDF